MSEIRKTLLNITKAYGNASANSIKSRVTIPASWAKKMGFTKEDRVVKMTFDGKRIILEKDDFGYPEEESQKDSQPDTKE